MRRTVSTSDVSETQLSFIYFERGRRGRLEDEVTTVVLNCVLRAWSMMSNAWTYHRLLHMHI